MEEKIQIKLDRQVFVESLRHFEKVMSGKNTQNNLRMLSIDTIVMKNKNLRKHSKKQLQKIKNAINKVGYTNPILLDEKLNLIAGELRLLAAKELDFPQIPAIILENLTEQEADIIRILDNRIAEDSEWHFDNLREELERLLQFDGTFEALGFDTVNYDEIFTPKDTNENKIHDSEQESYTWLDENIPKRVKAGDLWRLGDNGKQNTKITYN